MQSSPFTSKVPSGKTLQAVADMRIPHESWDPRDHVQLVGNAPAVRDALIIGASKGCISDPGRAKIIHGDAWPLPTPISAAPRNIETIRASSLCGAVSCPFTYSHSATNQDE